MQRNMTSYAFNVLLTCTVVYPYNMNQQDALFTSNLLQQSTSTCFEQTYCSSSGGITLYVMRPGWCDLHHDISVQYEPTRCTIYFKFTSTINLYMFRADLLLIIRSYYSVCYASGLRVFLKQHPSTRAHNLQPTTTPTTSHNQSYVPHAVNICIVSSSWWWA